MAKYFKNVKSYDDLKAQYKSLLKVNHPDNGGDLEIMKEINVEYDALFPIWKNRKETETGAPVQETADSIRSQFYTEFGWEGSRHDWNRSLKEVAQIVRAYVKEKYPNYKFSVRTSYASMCQELHVELKESPIEIYKTADELTAEDKNEFFRKANRNGYWTLNSWSDEEFKEEYNRITEEHGNFFKVLNEATKAVIDDVDDFVKSYNFEDCDGMIDYFHVDFYYFGCAQNNGINIKFVPNASRSKNKTAKPSSANSSASPEEKSAEKAQDAPQIEEKTGYTYKITKGEDTRDGSELWLVRIVETLDKSAYIAENQRIKALNGYYSKFRKAFIFRYDPTEALKTA